MGAITRVQTADEWEGCSGPFAKGTAAAAVVSVVEVERQTIWSMAWSSSKERPTMVSVCFSS